MDLLEGLHFFVVSFESLLCVLGNGLVIIAIIKFESLQTKTNLFVIALAISDFITGCIANPWALAVQSVKFYTLSNSSYNAWETACLVGNFIQSIAGEQIIFLRVLSESDGVFCPDKYYLHDCISTIGALYISPGMAPLHDLQIYFST